MCRIPVQRKVKHIVHSGGKYLVLFGLQDPGNVGTVIRTANAFGIDAVVLAGACAVQVGAANLKDPFACKNIIDDLPMVMDRYGIRNIRDIIGGAHG